LFVVALTNGYFMDWLRSRYGLSKWNQRFLSQFLHLVITPTLLMMCMFFGEDQKWLVFTLLVVATGFVGFQTSGVAVSFLDLLPRFSPLMNTLGNTLGALAGIIGPVVASELIVSMPGTTGWDWLFLITMAQCAVGIVLWYLFAKTEVDELLNTPIANEAEEDVE
jgi:MFS family permease